MSHTSEILILCPYCMSIIQKDIVVCNVCAEDLSRFLKLEVSQTEYSLEKRKDCAHCGKQNLHLASVCRHCQAVLRW